MENDNYSLKNKAVVNVVWSFFERVGNQIVSFVVSILLARILLPDDYGIIAIVLVFVNICDVFVTGGVGASLIRKKNVDSLDYSSIFFFNFMVSCVIYLLLFLSAPFIADFYCMPILDPVLKVLGIKVPFSAYNVIQRAIVSRNIQFKKFFFATLSSTVISAIVGCYFAKSGYGVWALVWQNLSITLFNTLVLLRLVKWVPTLEFSWERTKSLYSFGYKVLITSLIDVLYEDFRSLYVGKLYAPSDLAYYTRGKQFPYLITQNVNSSISSVLFPVMSKCQDDLTRLRNMMRKSIKITSFIITPLMFALAMVAKPLVLLLLTEKWINCVPFVQILCFNAILMPIQTTNNQALLAMGRSDITLKLNIYKKTFGFIVVVISASFSVIAMALGGILIGINASICNSSPNKKLLNYGYIDQMRDIMPSWIISILMAGLMYLVSLLDLPVFTMLLLQVLTGLSFYVIVSYLFHLDSFNELKMILLKRNK